MSDSHCFALSLLCAPYCSGTRASYVALSAITILALALICRSVQQLPDGSWHIPVSVNTQALRDTSHCNSNTCLCTPAKELSCSVAEKHVCRTFVQLLVAVPAFAGHLHLQPQVCSFFTPPAAAAAAACCSIWTSEVSGTISLLGIMAVYLASQELLVLVS
jgi:hypothetical protein